MKSEADMSKLNRILGIKPAAMIEVGIKEIIEMDFKK